MLYASQHSLLHHSHMSQDIPNIQLHTPVSAAGSWCRGGVKGDVTVMCQNVMTWFLAYKHAPSVTNGKPDSDRQGALGAHAPLDYRARGIYVVLALTSRIPMKDTMRRWCRREMCGVVSM